MITENDLLEAIAECQGTRNPNATTCLKLASYYTILDHIQDVSVNDAGNIVRGYSYASDEPLPIGYHGDTDFLLAVENKDEHDVMMIMDELMSALSVLNPKLYAGVMRKIAE